MGGQAVEIPDFFLSKKIYPAAALCSAVGVKYATFHNNRSSYRDLGIDTDRIVNNHYVGNEKFSVKQIIALAIVLKLNKIGPTSKEAAGAVAPLMPEFGNWIAAAENSRFYRLIQTEPDWRSDARWHLLPVDGAAPIAQLLASRDIVSLIDAGMIAAKVQAQLGAVARGLREAGGWW